MRKLIASWIIILQLNVFLWQLKIILFKLHDIIQWNLKSFNKEFQFIFYFSNYLWTIFDFIWIESLRILLDVLHIKKWCNYLCLFLVAFTWIKIKLIIAYLILDVQLDNILIIAYPFFLLTIKLFKIHYLIIIHSHNFDQGYKYYFNLYFTNC